MMVSRTMKQGAAAEAVVVAVMVALSKPPAGVDSEFSYMEFGLRGPVAMDSLIVVLAIRDSLLEAMKRVIELALKVAASDATILILEESGTGKELIAEAIHKFSGRSREPFVAINCGAIPESLLESELFGHEEGAYTSANKTKKGLFKAADHGTIFLEEIAETSEFFQTKLLRVLQSGEFN